MKIVARIIQWLCILILPFYVLIRLSLFLHDKFATNAWLSLAGGGLATIALITLYFTVASAWMSTKLGSYKAFKRRAYVAGFLVWGFCIYAVLFISGENVKHTALRQEFRSLHPVLRLGVSTLVLVDRDIIVTDAGRHPDDYQRMGLPTKKRSLHYPQGDGFVHALDLRTQGRPEWRNTLTRLSFRLMGFNTLRHVGTADHLHISLKSHDLPGAI